MMTRYKGRRPAAAVMLAAVLLLSGCTGVWAGCRAAASGALRATAAVSRKTSAGTAGSQPASGEAGVTVYFPRAGQDAEGALIAQLGTAKKTLDVAIYSFTDRTVANAVAAAAKRGVAVRMITDRENSGEASQKKALAVVKAAGVPIKVNTHSGIMHLKVSVIDGVVVTTGSFNYTISAQKENDENLVILRGTDIAAQYEAQFTRMWDDTAGFKQWS